MKIDMFAPTGDELQGTSETVLRACQVEFDQDGTFEHTGGDEVFWETSETKRIDGVPLFTCESGQDWLQHHLTPHEVEREDVPKALIELMAEEIRVGEVYEAVKRCREAYEAMIRGGSPTGRTYTAFQGQVDRLAQEEGFALAAYRKLRESVVAELGAIIKKAKEAYEE